MTPIHTLLTGPGAQPCSELCHQQASFSILFCAALAYWLHGPQIYILNSLFSRPGPVSWLTHGCVTGSLSLVWPICCCSWLGVLDTVPAYNLLSRFFWVFWQNLLLLPTCPYSGTVRLYGFIQGNLWLSSLFILCDEVMGCVGRGTAVDVVYLDYYLLNIHFTTDFFLWWKIHFTCSFFVAMHSVCKQIEKKNDWLILILVGMFVN